MQSETSSVPNRGPGRPRDPSTDDAILEAVEQLLSRDGYGQLTIDAVARRAGVGRPTVYRRWPDKAHLVLASLSRTRAPKTRTNTGSLRGDLLAIQRNQEHLFVSPTFQAVVPPILARLGNEPLLRERYETQFVQPRRQDVADALERAHERGELTSKPETLDTFDLLTGPLFYRVIVRSGRPTTAFRHAVVAGVMRVLADVDHD